MSNLTKCMYTDFFPSLYFPSYIYGHNISAKITLPCVWTILMAFESTRYNDHKYLVNIESAMLFFSVSSCNCHKSGVLNLALSSSSFFRLGDRRNKHGTSRGFTRYFYEKAESSFLGPIYLHTHTHTRQK